MTYSPTSLFYFRKFASPQANAWEHPYSQNMFNNIRETLLDKEGRTPAFRYDTKDKDYADPKKRTLTGFGGTRITKDVQNYLRLQGYTGDFAEGARPSDKINNLMFDRSIHAHLAPMYAKGSKFGTLNENDQKDIADFVYNTGSFNSWPNLTKAIKDGNINNIAKEMVNSKAYASGPSSQRLRGIVDRIARRNNLKNHYNPNYNAYYVKRGDNLASIAKRLGVTESYLRQHNNWINKDGTNLGIGSPIFTPIKNNAVVPENSPTSFSSQKYWTPRPGDTLWKYYKGNQKLINDFYIRNKLKQGSAIKAGTPYLI